MLTKAAAEPDPASASILDRRTRPVLDALPAKASASKGSSAYQVHTYPTKVPPAAIEPFIVASTDPGALVLDPFCGSGMTGLAALKVGRRTILSDLSPGAVHLAYNHTHPVPPDVLAAALRAVGSATSTLERQLYRSNCPTCQRPSMLRHLVWTDVHTCAACEAPIRVWDQSNESGRTARTLTCAGCGHAQSRSGVSGVVSRPAEKAVACDACRTLQRGPADAADLALLATIARRRLTRWVPSVPLGPDREMHRRSALQLRAVTDVADFWNHRSKLALSELWHVIAAQPDAAVRSALTFAFTNTAWHATRMRRYNAHGGQRPLTGTLHIPQLVAEGNAFEIFRHQVAQVSLFYATHPTAERSDIAAFVRRSSATDLSWLASSSVDYVFTDPPFGANLFYGDCNVVWEAWLGDVTDTCAEIVVNRSLPANAGGKTLDDYEKLLGEAFNEIRRTLSTGARASVVFHNADDKVWSALLSATDRARLVQTDVGLLDKVQRSMKGYKGRSGAELVPFYDLVITFTAGSRVPSAQRTGAIEVALEAVRRHLATLASTDVADGSSSQRSLEYLYSLSVGAVIASGHRPAGLSFRAFERLLRETLPRNDFGYFSDD